MQVYLNYDVRTTTEEIDPQPYGFTRRESEYSNIYLATTNNGYDYDSLTISDSLNGKEVHYCYATINTGDSFNSNRRDRIELLFVSESSVDAQKAYTEIRKSDNSSVIVHLDGKDVEIYLPWQGYFDSLEDIELETTTL